MDVIFLLVLLALLLGSIGLVQVLARLGERKSGDRP
jgi:hypothetical protein